MLDIRDLLNLKEAYAEIYASQELTEEQVWEEVETWVNSLIEEGYDLSDYTWEEMYESYIEEQGRGTRTGSNPNVYKPATTTSGPAGGGMGGRRGGGSSPGGLKPKPQMANLPPSARQVTQYPAGVPTGVGGGNAGASVQPAPRPDATAAPKPTATAAPRPTATAAAPKPAAAPAAKPAGSAMDQFAKANPKLAASCC
jgi:hypothetical protein